MHCPEQIEISCSRNLQPTELLLKLAQGVGGGVGVRGGLSMVSSQYSLSTTDQLCRSVLSTPR